MTSPLLSATKEEYSSSKPLTLHLRHRQRRRLPTVRLGGGRARRGWRRAGRRFIVGILRRLRLRVLISQYLKRIRACCLETMREIVDGAVTVEAVRARMLVESHFAVPVMPVSSVAFGNYLR